MGLIDFSALSPEERKALFNGPALEPPAGVIPNLENPPNDNVTGYAILTFLTAIVALSVGNRLYAGFLLGRASLADCTSPWIPAIPIYPRDRVLTPHYTGIPC